ncbi:MAG: hypothetical protein ABIR39_04810 [Nocardioides sp.]|uniref:hypothetical protein n=1 Tax=Nocardioides sp. TaxID=35761 RepID=UPI003267992C
MSAVSLGVLTATPQADEFLAASSSSGASALSSTVTRDDIVSRSESRVLAAQVAKREAKQEKKQENKATRKAIKRADTKMWTTAELNLWSGPEKKADKIGVLDGLEKVLVTGRKDNGRIEVVVNQQARWVSAGYFAEKKPETGPSLSGTCANGSAIDAGRASLYEIHDVVCANWPEITAYGTWRGDGEHGEGRAIDIMISGETGWAVADFLRANYSALGIEYIIFSQNIWSVERGGEGWRSMSDRGSTTANHYDHVHVTVY